MQKHRYLQIITYVVFIAAIFQTFGCSKQYNAITLEGQWKVVDMETNMPSVSPSIIAKGEKLALSTTYFFRSDNTCLVTSDYYPEGYEATWQFIQDSMRLKVESTDEIILDKSNFTIEFESARKIYISQNIEDLGDLKMTLTKRRQ